MSLLLRTALTNVSRRGLAISAVRRVDQVMPDPIEHATGEHWFKTLH